MRGEFRTMTRHFRVVFSAMAALALMASPLAARAMDWYGGLSYGQDRGEAAGGDLLGAGFSGSIDNNHTGWKALAGMQLWDKYVGAEFGYVDLGESKAHGTISGSFSAGTSKADAVTASAVGFIPVFGDLGVLIRAGLAFERENITTTGALGPGAHRSADYSDVKFFGGMGLQYDFTKAVSGRLEVEHFLMGSIGRPYVDLFSAGVIYRFQ
jgi:hypothetical protein